MRFICYIFKTISKKRFNIDVEFAKRMMGYLYRLKNYLLFLFLGLIVLSSCSYQGKRELLKSNTKIPKDSLKTVYVENPKLNYEVYRIKAHDLLQIRNVQNMGLIGGESTINSSNTKESIFRVEQNGYVTLPVIGDIEVKGLTRAEAAIKIQEAYKDKLFNNPIIELKIASLQVSVLGEVRAPGNYILEKEDTDLIDIIGQAGGTTTQAEVRRARIIRGERKNPEIIHINLTNINSLNNQKLNLQDGDIIIIERQKFFAVFDRIRDYSILSSLAITVLNSYLIIQSISRR